MDRVGTARALRRLGYLPSAAELELITAQRGGMAAEARLHAAANWTPAAAAHWAAVVRECGGGDGVGGTVSSGSVEDSRDGGGYSAVDDGDGGGDRPGCSGDEEEEEGLRCAGIKRDGGRASRR